MCSVVAEAGSRFVRRGRSGEPFALIRLHRFEDGRLRALTVQTQHYLAIVARRKNAPAAVVSEGRAVSLDWDEERERLERSGYTSVTLRGPAELLGPHRQIEPVWVWPSSSLIPQH